MPPPVPEAPEVTKIQPALLTADQPQPGSLVATVTDWSLPAEGAEVFVPDTVKEQLSSPSWWMVAVAVSPLDSARTVSCPDRLMPWLRLKKMVADPSPVSQVAQDDFL